MAGILIFAVIIISFFALYGLNKIFKVVPADHGRNDVADTLPNEWMDQF
jgi:hypothetical protein